MANNHIADDSKKVRLIDANWILGEIEHDIGCYEIEKIKEADGLLVELRDVVKMVCAAPTVDAVEVVRCKECKRWIPWSDRTQGFCPCSEHVTQASHFCSYGERRTDG